MAKGKVEGLTCGTCADRERTCLSCNYYELEFDKLFPSKRDRIRRDKDFPKTPTCHSSVRGTQPVTPR